MKKHLLLFALLLLISGAMFGQDEYNITYSPDSSHTFNGCYLWGDGTATAGVTVTVNIHTESGYELASIRAMNSNNQIVVLTGVGDTRTFRMPASDVRVSATFMTSTYTITYNLNGGTINGDYATSYTYGEGATLPTDVTKTGHTFGGWFDNAELTGTAVTAISATETGDKEFWAKWDPDTYTITYNLNGGTINGDYATSYTYGEGATLPTDVTKTGHTFGGWFDNAELTGTAVTAISATETGDKEFWAKWTPIYTITVSANPPNGGTVTGGGTYNQGQTCTVSATPAPGYHFDKWTENGSVVSTNANYTFPVTGDRDLEAHFTREQYYISVSANPTEGGTVSGGAAHYYGESCTVMAEENPGFAFVNWTENDSVVSPDATYQFLVTCNRNLVAQFQAQYTISVSANPTNGGTVTGGGTYPQGDSCTVSATPATGYHFVNWTENDDQVSTDANYTFIVTGNRTLVANFQAQQQTYMITVSANPTDGGEVTGGAAYHYGEDCTVTATASAGFTFTNWTENGSVVSTQANYTFTVNDNRNLVANFTHTYTISVSANPSNGGSVHVGSPTGPATGTFTQGQSCTVYATVNSGFTFTNWTENGTSVSTNANYTFTVNDNRNLVANFTHTYTISVSANPPEGGTVTGGGQYDAGANCTLTATPASGYEFFHWKKGNNVVSNNATYNFSVTENATYTAKFEKVYTITVNANNDEWGTVSGGGIFPADTTITITATAYGGFTFVKWQDGETNNPRQITVTENATYTATFTPNTYTIRVLANPQEGGTVYIGDSPSTTEQSFTFGDTCTVHAIPNQGFDFINWINHDTGEQHSSSQDYTFVVESDLTLEANFPHEGQIIIYVDIDPEEGGTVTGPGVYNQGDPCTLKAFPKPGYSFANWTLGDEVVSTNTTYSFTVTETEYYIAHFEKKKYTITVTAEPENGGDVSGGGYYYYHDIAQLEAIAKPGFFFTKWVDGDNVNVSNVPSFTIQVKENASYTAIFTKNHLFTINAIANPEEGGTVTVSGTTFLYGDVCTLTASANSGYTFSNWTLNDQPISNEETYSFQVTGDATFTANFTKIPQYTITVTASPEEGGTVTGGNSYQQGETCTVTATANEGYTFVNWTENGNEVTTNDSYTFPVNRDRNLVAIFKEIPCIDNLQEIVAKTHTEGNDKYTLILVYPNPNDESYTYQWLFSDEENGEYSSLKEGTYNKQYYYKGGRLKEGYYKVRVTQGECSVETEPYHVMYSGNTIRIYPNPSRRGNSIVVVNDCDGPAQLNIYSTDGRLLYTQTVTGTQAIVNISLPSGVYMAYLTNSDGYTKMGKLIIQ